MKKLVLFAALLTISFAASARETINGNDSRLTYIGRNAVADNATSFDWSGVTLIVDFEGTKLSMEVEDSDNNYYNVWVDKAPSAKSDQIIKLKEAKYIVKGLRKGHHSVVIQKRTEGNQGKVTVKTLSTDGSFTQARGLKERRIEVIGDSYTCGYGTESSNRNDPFKAETENCNLAYAQIIGRFFDADIQLVSHSGLGIARNYGGNIPDQTMVRKYGQTFDEAEGPAWEKDSFNPAIVVIYLGTNDFSTSEQPSIVKWRNEYAKLLKMIRANYPDVPVLCVASKANELLGHYVESAAKSCGLEKVYWTSIQTEAHNDTTELGASWHPNYEGQRKVATLMIPYISTITGWEMSHKAIE